MDKDKRSLLDDQLDSAQAHECYRIGMGLLHAVDQSSTLVVRFLAILEQLRGDGNDEDWSNLSRKNGHVDHSQQDSRAQASTFTWALNPLGPMLDNYIDFSDLDTFLAGFGDSESV